jgi:hypothetical protein
MDNAQRLLAQINNDLALNSLRATIKSLLIEGHSTRDILSDIKHQLLLNGKHSEVSILRDAISKLELVGIREDQ